MPKTAVKWLIITILAFMAGFLLNSYLNKPELMTNNVVNNAVYTRPIAYKNTEPVNMDEDTKKAYHKLVSEYFDYIKEQDEKTGFNEFLSIRKNKLVQQGKYASTDARIEEQVIEWYNKLNEINKIPGYEVNTYNVSGTVLPPSRNQTLCSIGDRKYLTIMVAAYLYQPTSDLFPVVPQNSIMPEQPIDYSLVDCIDGNFDLSFILSNEIEGESPPIYLVAYAFEGISHNYSNPIAIGTDKEISGIPPSILSKRKANRPVKIKLLPIKNKSLSSIISIKTAKDLIISPYGLDEIGSLMPEFNAFRTSITGSDGVARLKMLPMGSNFYLELMDKEKNKISLTIPTASSVMDVQIPSIENIKSKNYSALIIPPSNIKNGEVVIFSKSKSNKSTHRFNNQEREPIILENLSPVETFLELRSDNHSLGLMPLLIKEKTLIVVEPNHKIINNLFGKINLMNSIRGNYSSCKNCSIRIKFTDKIITADNSGYFSLSDINLIDNYAELNIESNDVGAIYPIIIHHPLENIKLDISIPSKSLLHSWNQVVPTIPGNGIVYGEFFKTSFKAFLVGFKQNIIKEAYYFSDKDGIPTKKVFSTSYTPGEFGFGRFMFPDVPQGEYVLYLIAADKILYSIIVRVESSKVTIIN